MSMYNHEDDDNGFSEFEKQLESDGPIQVNVNLPKGETLVINGIRSAPTIISVLKSAEINHKRDARMLAATLSTTLDSQTLYYLTEFLFTEHLAPSIQTQAMLEHLKKSTNTSISEIPKETPPPEE